MGYGGVKMGGREGTDGWENKRKPKDKQKGKSVTTNLVGKCVAICGAFGEEDEAIGDGRSGKDPRKQPLEDWEAHRRGLNILSGILTASLL